MSGHASVERLSLYVDAALPPAETQQVEQHLRACSDCRHRLAGLRRVVNRLELLPMAAPPSDLASRVRRDSESLGNRRGWADSLGPGLQSLLTGPPLIHVFALVVALAAILFLFSFGLARYQDRPTRIVLPTAGQLVPAAPSAVTPPSEEPPPSQLLLGGVFYRVGGVWVEQGLATRPPDQSVRLERPQVTAQDPELAALAALDAPVRLRVGEQVVEIAFEPGEPVAAAEGR